MLISRKEPFARFFLTETCTFHKFGVSPCVHFNCHSQSGSSEKEDQPEEDSDWDPATTSANLPLQRRVPWLRMDASMVRSPLRDKRWLMAVRENKKMANATITSRSVRPRRGVRS